MVGDERSCGEERVQGPGEGERGEGNLRQHNLPDYSMRAISKGKSRRSAAQQHDSFQALGSRQNKVSSWKLSCRCAVYKGRDGLATPTQVFSQFGQTPD